MKVSLFLYLSILCANLVFSQQKHQNWNTNDGLSNNWVSEITQDTEGYIWIATQYGLNKFDGYAFESFTHDPNNSNSITANWVKSIAKDSLGIFWLGVQFGGIDSFNPTTQKIQHYQIWNNNKRIVTSINTLLCTPTQTIVVASSDGLFYKGSESNEFEQLRTEKIRDLQQGKDGQLFFLTDRQIIRTNEHFKDFETVLEFSEGDIKEVFVDHKGEIWAIEQNALLQIVENQAEWEFVRHSQTAASVSLLFGDSPIFEDSNHHIWIGGETGISVVSPDRKSITYHSYTDLFPTNINKCQALSFFEDRHSNLWIGTNQGVFLKTPFTDRFLAPVSITEKDSFKDVRAFLQVEDKHWIADQNGLHSIKTNDNATPVKTITDIRIYDLLRSKNGSLYGAGNGFFKIDSKSLQVSANLDVFKDYGRSWSLVEDWSGKIWISSIKALLRFDPETGFFDSFTAGENPSLQHNAALDLLIDSKGRLWLTTLKSGIYMLQKPHSLKKGETPDFINFNYKKEEPNSLSSKLTTTLFEDMRGTIWVGTDAGLNRIDGNTFETTRFLKKEGLIDEKIMALEEDNMGYIWGSTVGHGLFRLDPNTLEFNLFGENDGLVANNFLLSSVYKDEDGLLFFGTDNGIQVVDPKRIESFEKPVIDFHFTTLASTNEQRDKIELTPLRQRKNAALPYNHGSFDIQYTTINYHQAEKTKYWYKIDGVHNDWRPNDTRRTLSFAGLSPNNYILSVKAENPDIDFKQDTIRLGIIINPPWWLTIWAKGLYALLLLVLLYMIYTYQLKRKLEQAERIRLKEVDVLKTNFYTNITHELRTPLTLISTPVQEQLARKDLSGKNRKVYNMILKSNHRMTSLIDQLLDLSKLEAKHLKLKVSKVQVAPFVKTIIEPFAYQAKTKNIRFKTDYEFIEHDIFLDTDAFEKILANLLSNALKYTKTNGDINFQCKTTTKALHINLGNTGIGFTENQKENLFNRYYQADKQSEGFGIGLALIRELVQLHKGKISVENQLGSWVAFKVTLPIHKGAFKPDEVIPSLNEKGIIENTIPIKKPFKTATTNTEKPLLLLVEDNSDLTISFQNTFNNSYNIITALNGEVGIEKALKHVPDLIVSDVMMPIKDGISLTKALKNSEITSHIPIILLTAKAGEINELQGLGAGADDYITKPFSTTIIRSKMANLVNSREKLRQYYNSMLLVSPIKANSLTPEVLFFEKLKRIIDKHLEDNAFNAEQFSKAVGMSRMQLHRKLKALTGFSATEFIRHQRLLKAIDILKTSNLTVNEVAYAVGFNTPTYFMKCFKETFNKTPSEYLQSIK